MGVGVRFKVVKGGGGTKTAARFFASGVWNVASAVIQVRGLPGYSSQYLIVQLFDSHETQGYGKILCGRMVGTYAGDVVDEIALAIEMGADAVDVGKTLPTPLHPRGAKALAWRRRLRMAVART